MWRWTIPVIAVLVAGCASGPDQIAATPVSPVLYQHLDCYQLSTESQRVADRTAVVTEMQIAKAHGDAALVGAAIVALPLLALLAEGDGPTASELARLKGEKEALEKASAAKRCLKS